MEQNKITFAHLFLGIFVIGLVLMAISFTELIGKNEKLILSVSIYLTAISVILLGIFTLLKISNLEDVLRKSGLKNTEELFAYTNLFWCMMLITTNLDNYIMYDFREFEFSEITNMIVFVGIFLVNIIVGILCFQIDFSVPIIYFKSKLGFLDFVWIIIITTFIMVFGIVLFLLIKEYFPLTAISFTFFNLILINILSGKLKYTTWIASY
ncbi:hypothetical protein [Empedobacter sp. UBA7248]|uniref:hypothetical protein n=1 Tax=Empedobacter sp. UBA7248 TaxID=1946448 RepID=UPI0025C6B8D6|nr:hypothetical protein [Empedobacter sp. UBA7248]